MHVIQIWGRPILWSYVFFQMATVLHRTTRIDVFVWILYGLKSMDVKQMLLFQLMDCKAARDTGRRILVIDDSSVSSSDWWLIGSFRRIECQFLRSSFIEDPIIMYFRNWEPTYLVSYDVNYVLIIFWGKIQEDSANPIRSWVKKIGLKEISTFFCSPFFLIFSFVFANKASVKKHLNRLLYFFLQA